MVFVCVCWFVCLFVLAVMADEYILAAVMARG